MSTMSTSPEKIFEVIQTWCANRLNSVDESGGPCRARFLGSEAASEMLEIYQALQGQEKQTVRAFTQGIVALTKLYPPSEFDKNHDKLEIKAGVVDGKVITVDEIKRLADLPQREVLIAQALGGFNAPIQGFANVLQGTIRSLAIVLNAVAEKQQA